MTEEQLESAKVSDSREKFNARVARLEREFNTTYTPHEINMMWCGWEWSRLAYQK